MPEAKIGLAQDVPPTPIAVPALKISTFSAIATSVVT